MMSIARVTLSKTIEQLSNHRTAKFAAATKLSGLLQNSISEYEQRFKNHRHVTKIWLDSANRQINLGVKDCVQLGLFNNSLPVTTFESHELAVESWAELSSAVARLIDRIAADTAKEAKEVVKTYDELSKLYMDHFEELKNSIKVKRNMTTKRSDALKLKNLMINQKIPDPKKLIERFGYVATIYETAASAELNKTVRAMLNDTAFEIEKDMDSIFNRLNITVDNKMLSDSVSPYYKLPLTKDRDATFLETVGTFHWVYNVTPDLPANKSLRVQQYTSKSSSSIFRVEVKQLLKAKHLVTFKKNENPFGASAFDRWSSLTQSEALQLCDIALDICKTMASRKTASQDIANTINVFTDRVNSAIERTNPKDDKSFGKNGFADYSALIEWLNEEYLLPIEKINKLSCEIMDDLIKYIEWSISAS